MSNYIFLDPNEESDERRRKLREYYEDFSENARKRLLSRNVIRPNNVYDVLYVNTREALLAKNISISTDLKESSRILRDSLVSKYVSEKVDLEVFSEQIKKSQIARNALHGEGKKLIDTTEDVRKRMLSNKVENSKDLKSLSSSFRKNNISKNVPQNNDDLDKKSDSHRILNLSKNDNEDSNLSELSKDIRDAGLSKNVESISDLDKLSKAYRDNNLSNNTNSVSDLKDSSKIFREDSVSKNIDNSSGLKEISEDFRDNNESKNVYKEFDLLSYSEGIRNKFRNDNLVRNVENSSDLNKDGKSFRNINLSKNIESKNDLKLNSDYIRIGNLSKNVKNENNSLDEISKQKLEDSAKQNISSKINLERDSEDFKKNNLEKNISNLINLEEISNKFRRDKISKNIPLNSDLKNDSKSIREDNLVFNIGNDVDLFGISELFREENLSLNVSSESDLDRISYNFRNNNLSNNSKGVNADLEVDSIPFRKDNLIKNNYVFTDLETISTPFRNDDLSLNTSTFSNLEIDSTPFRVDDLSLNTPVFTNLESDSVPFRNDDLSLNTPVFTNLEIDSAPFRVDDLSQNVPSFSDLLVDSVPFLFINLSANVPSFSDLETDSIPFREGDLSSNIPSFSDLEVDSVPFREGDLLSNVPSFSNLSVDSTPFLIDNLSNNVFINSNLQQDSSQFRDSNLSHNVSSSSNLNLDSKVFRENLISKNHGLGLIGATINGAGTSAFIGVSRLLVQSVIPRNLLLSKNAPSESNLADISETYRIRNLIPNKWTPDNEFSSSSDNYKLGRIVQGSINTDLVDYSPVYPYPTPTARAIFATDDYIVGRAKDLQKLYGNSYKDIDFPTKRRNRNINDSQLSVDTLNPKGHSYGNYFFNRQTYVPFWEGTVTSAIRRYQLERNTYNTQGLQAGDLSSYTELTNVSSEGFQSLIASTIGSFNPNSNAGSQTSTNATPASIIIGNGGSYYKGGHLDADLMKPEAKSALIGSAESMAAKTVLGNPYSDRDFDTGRRGIKRIINTIKNSDLPFASNFDPQNSTVYVTGLNKDGSPRISRQKFTIANPNAPVGAGKILFSLKNYASGDQLYFPPYIQNISNTDNASWNQVNFLGRPEAVYTYNNSSRDATITFHILTDYTQKVDIGTNWDSDAMETITESFPDHFTSSDKSQNDSKRLKLETLDKLRMDKKTEISNLEEKERQNRQETIRVSEGGVISSVGGLIGGSVQSLIKSKKEKEKQLESDANFQVDNGSAWDDESRAEKEKLKDEIAKIDGDLSNSGNNFNRPTNYSESGPDYTNIYNINTSRNEFNNGEIEVKAEDTSKRLDVMKKGLKFQPAYFSGDKIDFVRKAEFLSKMTRPSRNDSKTGFSFTKPPVCHIKLGDWWDHDIIVNSVSFDYDEAPWTLDGGRVQPMWASVTINFNMVGPYGSNSTIPPLSGDEGGMFSPVGGITKA